MPLPVFLDVFAHKKKKTVDNFDCPVNAKDEVFDIKERAVAQGKAPEILRIKKQWSLRFNTMLPSYAVDHDSDCRVGQHFTMGQAIKSLGKVREYYISLALLLECFGPFMYSWC